MTHWRCRAQSCPASDLQACTHSMRADMLDAAHTFCAPTKQHKQVQLHTCILAACLGIIRACCVVGKVAHRCCAGSSGGKYAARWLLQSGGETLPGPAAPQTARSRRLCGWLAACCPLGTAPEPACSTDQMVCQVHRPGWCCPARVCRAHTARRACSFESLRL